MKKVIILISILIIIIISIIIGFWIWYTNSLKPVNGREIAQFFTISSGQSSNSIATELVKDNLIKSKFSFKLYLKLNNITNLQAATYSLSPSMSTNEIIEKFEKGQNVDESISITFMEGINMRKVAQIISDRTNNTYDNVLSLLKDEAYLDEIIAKYWFITKDIKDDEIYYSLEGYLQPNTYIFENKDISIKTIFNKMLDQTEIVLNKYKEKIEKSDLNVHEILTLSSIVDIESSGTSYYKDIASVFYNRLNSKMMLGSDVTTYYGAKIDMGGGRDLTVSELAQKNAYNTRTTLTTGKLLPVSPVAAPSEKSIEATINPSSTNHLYFVADKNGEVFFSKTYDGHLQNVNSIKSSGNWIF
ncbi:MAG: endolytic transglycosylase MltG [Bacilli bacterium]